VAVYTHTHTPVDDIRVSQCAHHRQLRLKRLFVGFGFCLRHCQTQLAASLHQTQSTCVGVVCGWVYVCVCVCVWLCSCTPLSLSVCVCVCVCVRVRVCCCSDV